ncbi:MAG: Ig-like domain-containing protein, partial [Thiovulaceae bacterium]|nr:Ig-like domain-containing protein [Sulfurimonadaceae bacterium]
MKTIIKYITILVLLSASAWAIPSTPDLRSLDDNGDFSNDNITSLTNLTFTGTKAENEIVYLYMNGTYKDVDNSIGTTYTLTDNAAPSGTLSYYVSGDTTSETLNVEVVTAITEGSVTVDDVTADNNINENEDDGFVTLSGSASGGDISNGDNVRVIINGNTYNTTLSFGTFSFNVLGSDIIANPGFFVYVDSSNEFGHTGSSSGYKSVGTDNSSTFTVTSVDETTITNSTDGFLIDGITVRISTDVVNNRTIIIDS